MTIKYGSAHRQKRARLAPSVAAGTERCARCGELIGPGQAWDLDHDDDDPTRHIGASHRGCNRAVVSHLKKAAERARMAAPCECNRVTMTPCSHHSRVW